MFTIESDAVLEGTSFTVLARIVGTDKTVLGQDGAGPLIVDVFTAGGAAVFKKSLAVDVNGIVAPQVGSGWTRPGVFNFSYTMSAAALAAESPPFAFKAPQTYKIVFTHISPADGPIKTVAVVPVK